MLVLSRKTNEDIVIPTLGITIRIVEVGAGKVRIGVIAPKDVPVHRREVHEKIQSQEVACR